MRDILEQLLRRADGPSPERAEELWVLYRDGTSSTDPQSLSAADTAFATLVAWYGNALYRRIWGFIRCDAAEDVLQTVWAELHRNRHRLPTFTDAHRWLRATADRRCRDARRRETRRKRREVAQARSEADEADAAARTRKEQQDSLAVALEKLGERDRQMIALHYFEGLDKQDAAEVLGINRDTFAKRLDVALMRLRKLLPAPAVIASTGVIALPPVLAAHPTPLSALRLGEIVRYAWTAPAAGWGRAKVAALVLLLGGSGLGVGAVLIAGSAEQPDPEPVRPPIQDVSVDATATESVSDRHLRYFQDELHDELLRVLQPLALNNGTVELASIETFDTRMSAEFVLRHNFAPRPGWTSRLRYLCDFGRESPVVQVLFDMYADGNPRTIEVGRPIVLWQDQLLGTELTLNMTPLDDSLVLFARVPQDQRTIAERAAHHARVRAALTPYFGKWYREGDPGKVCRIEFQDGRVVLTGEKGVDYNGMPDLATYTRFEGGLRLLPVKLYHPTQLTTIVFQPDVTRIDFPEANTFWVRKPILGN